MTTIKVGLIGTNGSGKSTACAYLKEKGFYVISLSDIVRESARAQGLPLTRENLISTGNAMKSLNGLDCLARQALSEAPSDQPVVFDSIRHPLESEFLKSEGVLLLGIDAPIELRFERIQGRNGSTDHLNFQRFQELDEREQKGQSSGQNIQKTIEACDAVFQNTGSLEELHLWLDGQLEKKKSHV